MPPVDKAALYDPSNIPRQPLTMPTKFELNQPSIVKRLWSGISRTGQDTQPIIAAYKLFHANGTNYLLGLCKDLKIRVFCLKSDQCIFVEDVAKHGRVDSAVIWEESLVDVIMTSAGLVVASVCLTSASEFRVCNLRVEIGEGGVRLSEVSKKIVRRKGKLVDLCLSGSKVWLMYKNEQECIEVVTIAIDESNVSVVFLEEGRERLEKREARRGGNEGGLDTDDEEEADYEEDELINSDCSKMDIKERYLKVIFEPYRFSRINIFKALGVSFTVYRIHVY